MTFAIHFTRAQLKVFSAICSNFVVLHIAALGTVQNPTLLIFNTLAAIVFSYFAVQSEEFADSL